jgi:hypothetical protein
MGARRYRAWPALAIILNESVGTHGEKPRTHINRRAIAKRAGLAGFTTLRHTRASYGPAQGLENCWGKSRRISRQRLEEGLAKERAARCVVLAGLDQSEGASLIQRRRRGMLPRLTSPIRASHRRVSRNGAVSRHRFYFSGAASRSRVSVPRRYQRSAVVGSPSVPVVLTAFESLTAMHETPRAPRGNGHHTEQLGQPM